MNTTLIYNNRVIDYSTPQDSSKISASQTERNEINNIINKRLITRIQHNSTDSDKAIEILIERNKPLVASCANKYRNKVVNCPTIDIDDLIQEGNIALMQTVYKFNANDDATNFEGYVRKSINNSILLLLIDNNAKGPDWYDRGKGADIRTTLADIIANGNKVTIDTEDYLIDLVVKRRIERYNKANQGDRDSHKINRDKIKKQIDNYLNTTYANSISYEVNDLYLEATSEDPEDIIVKEELKETINGLIDNLDDDCAYIANNSYKFLGDKMDKTLRTELGWTDYMLQQMINSIKIYLYINLRNYDKGFVDGTY